MARRDLVTLGLLLLCIIVMLFFKRKKKEGFAACGGGYFYNSVLRGCMPCPAGTYGTNGVACIACPAGKTSSAGSFSASQCYVTSCSAGYYLSSGSCIICGANTYGGGGASTSCTACPVNSISSGLSTSISACACKANFYGTNGSCTACPPGRTSSVASTSISQCKCPANTYLNGTVCTPCPTGTTSGAGSTSISQCICPANTYIDGTTCIACPTGSTTAAGSTSISQCKCPSNSYMNGTTCTTCPTGSTTAAGSTSISQCKCPSNSYMNGTTCTTCPTGSTTAAGSTSISQCKCPANQYLNGTICTTCPTGSTSPAGSTSLSACTCAIGMNASAMTPLTSSSTTCTISSCLGGYALLANGTCSRCTGGSYSAVGSTSCTPCPAGSISGNGASTCSFCSANSYSLGGTTSCTACPTGTTSPIGSTAISSCICPNSPGATAMEPVLSNTLCKASSCLAGFGLSAIGTCQQCALNTYGPGGASQCTRCPTGSTSIASSTNISACTCTKPAGTAAMEPLSATNTTCKAASCNPGFGLLATGTCQQCGANTFGTGGTSQCANCPAGSVSPVGSTSQTACTCPAGTRSVTLNGVTKCVASCPTMTKPPRTQGSDQAALFALANCAAKTFNYNNNGVMQTTNPCVNSFYDFDLQKCVNAVGVDVGLGSSTPCSSSTVYSSATNACVPVRVIVKPGDPQLINTTGSPSQGDFRDCKTVDKGDCTILFKDPLGNSLTANPCAGNNELYNFATKTCVAKTKACCNYTDPLKAAADKSCAADTNLVITKNTALCPATSRTLCCNTAYATNTTCIKNNFWRPSYAFTAANRAKCASGFEDYQGMHLLNKKMAKMNRIV